LGLSIRRLFQRALDTGVGERKQMTVGSKGPRPLAFSLPENLPIDITLFSDFFWGVQVILNFLEVLF
tara:strand:- start:843 stop:1043 length:201 start_codon:yes stop_codon:yes gene_type:complete